MSCPVNSVEELTLWEGEMLEPKRHAVGSDAGIRHLGRVHVFPGATVSESDESSEGGEEGVASEGSQPKRIKLDRGVLS